MFAHQALPAAVRALSSALGQHSVGPPARALRAARSRPIDAKSPRSSFAIGNQQIWPPQCFQQVARACPHAREHNLSPFRKLESPQPFYEALSHCLSVAYTLLLRSFAKERKLTTVFSSACALFCECVGVLEKIRSTYLQSILLTVPNQYDRGSIVEVRYENFRRDPRPRRLRRLLVSFISSA